MTDDHAQAALSSYGNRILKTPNLDRIGAEGVRFTEAFVTNSLCLPSRATYLTGLYSHTHGLMTDGEELALHERAAARQCRDLAEPAPRRRLLHGRRRQMARQQPARGLRLYCRAPRPRHVFRPADPHPGADVA